MQGPNSSLEGKTPGQHIAQHIFFWSTDCAGAVLSHGMLGRPTKIERQEYEPSDLVHWYVYAESLASAPLWDLSLAQSRVESLSFFVSMVLALTLLTAWLQLETEFRTMGGVRLLGLLGGGFGPLILR